MRIGADRAGDLAVGDDLARSSEALTTALHLCVVAGEDDTERHRLGEDAVAPADHRGLHVLASAGSERGEKAVEP